MLPIRDAVPRRTRPWGTLAVMAIQASLALGSWWGWGLDGSLVPVTDGRGPAGTGGLRVPLSTSAIGAEVSGATLVLTLVDLLILWLFGASVEDRFGHARFVGFCLVASTITLSIGLRWAPPWAPAWSMLPVATAGMLAAVMGAYLALFPRSRVLVLVPWWPGPRVSEVAVTVVMALWSVLQLVLTVGAPGPAGTTWLALGLGLGLGGVAAPVLRRPERMGPAWWDPLPG